MLPYLFHKFLISDPCISSDHCHIQFSLYNNTQRTSVTEDIDTANTHTHTLVDYTYTWDESKTQQYLDSLHTDQITEAFTNLSHDIESIHSPTQINDNLHTFSNLLHDVCDPLFTKPCNNKNKNPKSQPWYDAECKAKITEFYSQLNTFRTDSSSQNRVNMVRTRSQYKPLLR